MTVFEGIFRSEGTREGRGQLRHQHSKALPLEASLWLLLDLIGR
jgi:hypothetical protein